MSLPLIDGVSPVIDDRAEFDRGGGNDPEELLVVFNCLVKLFRSASRGFIGIFPEGDFRMPLRLVAKELEPQLLPRGFAILEGDKGQAHPGNELAGRGVWSLRTLCVIDEGERGDAIVLIGRMNIGQGDPGRQLVPHSL